MFVMRPRLQETLNRSGPWHLSAAVVWIAASTRKNSRDLLKGRPRGRGGTGWSTQRSSRWIGELLCAAEWIPSSHSTGAHTLRAKSRQHFARDSTSALILKTSCRETLDGPRAPLSRKSRPCSALYPLRRRD